MKKLFQNSERLETYKPLIGGDSSRSARPHPVELHWQYEAYFLKSHFISRFNSHLNITFVYLLIERRTMAGVIYQDPLIEIPFKALFGNNTPLLRGALKGP